MITDIVRQFAARLRHALRTVARRVVARLTAPRRRAEESPWPELGHIAASLATERARRIRIHAGDRRGQLLKARRLRGVGLHVSVDHPRRLP